MKIKNKLLSIVVPTIIVGSISPFVGYMSSCSSKVSKKESKYPTVTMKMDNVQSLNDATSTTAPLCVLNTDTKHIYQLHYHVPSSTDVKAFYQVGTYDPTTNKVTWPTSSSSWIEMVNEDTEEEDKYFVQDIEYYHPIRIYAYNDNEDTQGRFNTRLASGNKGNIQFHFAFKRKKSGSIAELGKGIKLAGSIRSLLGTAKIYDDGLLDALEDLNSNSATAFSGLFSGELSSHAWNGDICEVAPGFLPFKTMISACYSRMFENNTNLTEAPDLPSTNLAAGCYMKMFDKCSSLRTSPYLPARTLAPNCYREIFYECSNLNSVSLGYVGNFVEQTKGIGSLPMYFNNWLSEAGTPSSKLYYDGEDTEQSASAIPSNFTVVSKKTTDPTWLDRNTSVFELKDDKEISETQTSLIKEGAKTKFRAYKTQTINDIGTQIPRHEPIDSSLEDYEGYYKKVEGNEPEQLEFKLTDPVTVLPSTVYVKYQKPKDTEDKLVVNITANDTTSVKLSNKASGVELYYKKGIDGTFTKWTGSEISLEKDEIVKLYGDVKTTSSENYTNIKITGNAKLSGNVMSLLSTTYGTPASSLTREYCFANLFKGSTGITSVSEDFIPSSITLLQKGCYYHMFDECTNLQNGIPLPATTLTESCYEGMYYNCSSITTAPKLSATSLANYCYQDMYNGCSLLANVSKEYLPVTTLATSCYESMFSSCKSLVEAPNLPATTLKTRCYYCMFEFCESLTTPSILGNPDVMLEADNNVLYEAPGNIFPIENMFDGCKSLKCTKDPSIHPGAKKFIYTFDYKLRYDGMCWFCAYTIRNTTGDYKGVSITTDTKTRNYCLYPKDEVYFYFD